MLPEAEHLEALENRKSVADQGQSSLRDQKQVCPQLCKAPAVESALEANSIHHNHYLNSTNITISTSDMYDDEIWECDGTSL